MKIGEKNNEEMNVKIDEVRMEQAKQFKYLDATIGEDGNFERKTNERMQATTKLYYAINNPF